MGVLRAILGAGFFLLVAASCGGPKAAAPPTATVPSGSPTAAGTAPSPPGLSTPVPPDEVERLVHDCLASISSGGITQAAQEMKVCLDDSSLAERERYGARTFGVEGELPVMLLGLLGPDCRFTYEYIAWRSSSGWQLQYMTSQLPACQYTLFGRASSGPAALEAGTPDGTRLAVIDSAPCCGSAPGASLVLFQLDADGLRIVWDGARSEMAKLSHGEVEFAGDGIDLINVGGDSWFYPDDKKDIFHESNPGPHRHFQETWALRSDGYVLAEQRVVPSAYNTLVELIYRLSTGDEAGAAGLLADPALIAKAKALGLVQAPLGQGWDTNLDPQTECCGPIHILEGPPQQVTVLFTHYDRDWLISDIKPEQYRPSD